MGNMPKHNGIAMFAVVTLCHLFFLPLTPHSWRNTRLTWRVWSLKGLLSWLLRRLRLTNSSAVSKLTANTRFTKKLIDIIEREIRSFKAKKLKLTQTVLIYDVIFAIQVCCLRPLLNSCCVERLYLPRPLSVSLSISGKKKVVRTHNVIQLHDS